MSMCNPRLEMLARNHFARSHPQQVVFLDGVVGQMLFMLGRTWRAVDKLTNGLRAAPRSSESGRMLGAV